MANFRVWIKPGSEMEVLDIRTADEGNPGTYIKGTETRLSSTTKPREPEDGQLILTFGTVDLDIPFNINPFVEKASSQGRFTDRTHREMGVYRDDAGTRGQLEHIPSDSVYQIFIEGTNMTKVRAMYYDIRSGKIRPNRGENWDANQVTHDGSPSRLNLQAMDRFSVPETGLVLTFRFTDDTNANMGEPFKLRLNEAQISDALATIPIRLFFGYLWQRFTNSTGQATKYTS